MTLLSMASWVTLRILQTPLSDEKPLDHIHPENDATRNELKACYHDCSGENK